MNLIAEMWVVIEQTVDNLALCYEKVRLYQDGLPVCGREVEIITELAKTGSYNYRLLLELTKKGATIMGSESPDLLLEEYQLTKQLLSVKDPREIDKIDAHQKNLRHSLLKKRDQFIANRINTTLSNGETAILFLGLLHSLVDKLDKDIQIIYPINKP
ncbi:MAG: hypothetical protein AB1489_10515 [Acidobacteriota bacterium]